MTLDLYKQMGTHISDERLEKIEAAASNRTRYLTAVLENVYYTQNISAVTRTLDCLGIQELTLIGQMTSTKVNKHVAQGAGNWVDLNRRQDEDKIQVLKELKAEGYRLIATSPNSQGITPYNLPLQNGKIALVLGNEMEGISDEVFAMADETISIPMYGFTESYNISVSAAMIFGVLVERLLQEEVDFRLSPQEQQELSYRWIKNSIKFSDRIEEEHMVRLAHPNDQA